MTDYNQGWIKLHREFQDWEWFHCPNHVKFYVYLLLNANWKKRRWKGIEILPGQIVTGRKQLSKILTLSEQTVRTILNHLKSTSEVTIQTTAQYTIITIAKWNDYQQDNQATNQQLTNDQPTTNQQLTNDQPTTNQQLTTTKETKESKELKQCEEREELIEFKKCKETEKAAPLDSPKNLLASEVKKLWNEITFKSLPKALKVTDKRRKSINASSKELLKTIDDWHKYFEKILTSKFLCGQSGRGWKADFEWAINKNNVLKVLEGKYDNQNSTERNYAQENADRILSMRNPFLNEGENCE